RLDEHWILVETGISAKTEHSYRYSPTLGIAKGAGRIPMSSAQASMWHAGKLHGTQSIYNESEALFILGRLDQAVLNESVQRLQSRHIAFCMMPEVSQGNLVGWHINDTKPIIPLQVLDWNKEHGDISGILMDEARKPFE